MAQVNLGHVVGPGVPTGGTAGQVLKKNGSTNFDASWATLNSGNIPVSASDNTTVQQSLAATKGDIGIVEDGNTATHTIPAGYYVIWKGALKTASVAIPSGTTLSSSNLTDVPDGGLNSLRANLPKRHSVQITTNDTGIYVLENFLFDNVISIAVETTTNYYVVMRKSLAGNAVIFAFGSSFNVLANTAMNLSIWTKS